MKRKIYVPLALKTKLDVVGFGDYEICLPDEWAGVLPAFFDLEEMRKIYPDNNYMTGELDEST
jgi:hypothetical protein